MPEETLANTVRRRVPKPPFRAPPARRLRVYAFDPNASLDLGSAKYSHATISLAWDDPSDGELLPGPINEYLEVIDYDPCSGQFYEPIDLNAPEILAQDGLPPSEGDPRFHQQMVFAVVMKTIKLFERALGRKMIWRPKWDDVRKTYVDTPRLRVYPHALREANAYYSPEKRALLFGYFTATQRSAGASWIFTALSHDIIVHETTHAILDGLHPRYSEPTSVDSMAFHEAFADIAALFSHFQLYEAVYDYIANSGGRLDQSGLLSDLAGQFAKGTSGHAALRDYIDTDEEKKLSDEQKADMLADATEPHDRGAVLVAAVFDAFLSIYTARTEDLLRMSGTRLGSSQHLHPDLVARLTKEATKSADHVLRMCIRALDYLPPVDVRFGEFLRAVVTADADLVPDDRMNYRLAFVEAFRRRGIFPDHCLSMSPDNLMWDEPAVDNPEDLSTADILDAGLDLLPKYKRRDIVTSVEANRRKVWYWLTQPYVTVGGDPKSKASERLHDLLERARQFFAGETEETFAPDDAAIAGAGEIPADQRGGALRSAAAAVEKALHRSLAAADTPTARKGCREAEAAIRRLNAIALLQTWDADAQKEIEDARSNAAWAASCAAVHDFVDDVTPAFELANFRPEQIAWLRDALANERTHIGQWDRFLFGLQSYPDMQANPAVDQTWEAALGIFFQRPESRDRPADAPAPNPLFSISHAGGIAELSLKVEVHSVRTTRRAGPDGQEIRQLVIEVAQRRQGYLDPEEQQQVDAGQAPARYGDFVFRGGATLIIDLREGRLRYVISKRINDEGRLEAQRQFLLAPGAMGFTYDQGRGANEPFALLHRR